jgi:hypothetical protein
MARFLSTAMPSVNCRGPVSLFNLFKYAGGDPSIHDKYMGNFKRQFGESAGASGELTLLGIERLLVFSSLSVK